MAAFGECVGLSPSANATMRPSIVWFGGFVYACALFSFSVFSSVSLSISISISFDLSLSLSISLYDSAPILCFYFSFSISLLVYIYLTRSRRVFCTHTCASLTVTPASFSSRRIPRISTPCRRVSNTCTMVCKFMLLYVASEICFLSSSESYTFMSILAFTNPLT